MIDFCFDCSGEAVREVVEAVLLSEGCYDVFEVSCGRKGAASRSQTKVGLNGKRNSIVEPAKRGVRSALTVPWIW